MTMMNTSSHAFFAYLSRSSVSHITEANSNRKIAQGLRLRQASVPHRFRLVQTTAVTPTHIITCRQIPAYNPGL